MVNYLYVDAVRMDTDGRGMIYFSSPLTSQPSCVSAGYENILAFDTNTIGGDGIFKLALAAQLSSQRIYAKGLGFCTIYSGVAEDWAWGRVSHQ
jgi:hypothetical protein